MNEQLKKITIRTWLREYFGELLNVSADQIDPARSIFDFGISSQQAVRLVGKLEQKYRLEIEATIAYDFSTIDELAAELASRDAIMD